MRPIDADRLLKMMSHWKPYMDMDNVRDAINKMPTLTPPNEPLTQADLDGMDYDKVWIDYGDEGEWALVVNGRICSLAVLEGAGFEDILKDEVGGETMDRPSGDYTVYRRPPKAKDNNVPTNEPLTLDELREMDGEPVWVVMVDEKFSGLNGWYLVHHGSAYLARIDDWELDDDKYGVEWLAYRRPPDGL